jgi:hypothetical protein
MSEKKPLTEKQEAFLDALVEEAKGDIRTAMRIAGYSDTTKMREVVEPLRHEIIERSSMFLAMNAPKASHSLVDVLLAPDALGARNAVQAAAQVLDRVGLVKKEQIEVSAPAGGLFVLPPKKSTTQNDDDTE